MKKLCNVCLAAGKEEPSLKGLTPGYGLCQYHYNERMWGTKWADEMLHIEEAETAAVAKYRCNCCERVYWRKSTKAWIPSYCEKLGVHARLYRLLRQHVVPDHEVRGPKPKETDNG